MVGEDPALDAKRFRRTENGVCLITQPMIDRLGDLMRVLSVTSEVYPLIKTGGLADVAGALPPALGRARHRDAHAAARLSRGDGAGSARRRG